MGVNADVGVVGETEVHDAAEYPVGLRITGYTVDYMVRPHVIKPFALIDSGVCRFWGWQEGEVAYNLVAILNDIATILLHVSSNDSLRRLLLFLCLTCKLKQRLWQMTITCRIFVEIVLMVFFGRIVVLQGQFLQR